MCMALAAALHGIFPFGTEARSQSTDQLGRILGTKPADRSEDGRNGVPAPPQSSAQAIVVPILLKAGQSLLLRTGASSLANDPASPPTFRLITTPKCGVARAGADGVVITAPGECVGQKLLFTYEISATGAAAPASPLRVDVQASVTKGIESCGISDAPFNFITIPGGTYSLADAPARLADIAKLAGKKELVVKSFCIGEEAVPASEMASFLAGYSFSEMRKSFPEALYAAGPASIEIETGRELRSPAVAVSLKMANAYATSLAPLLKGVVRLPTLDEYVAAAVHLERNAPEEAATHSFSVSLRGGLIEWTSSDCPSSRGSFLTIGRQRLRGELEILCFEPSQRLGRMGFRLVMERPQ